MKKTTLKIIASIAIVLSITGCNTNNDGEGKQVGTSLSNNDLFEPDYYYEIDTWGSNADVFEFTMKSNPNMVIINVGEGTNRGIFVIPKGTKSIEPQINSKSDSNPLYNPSHYYEIDTWGSNADIFEFTPRSNADYTCVVVGANHSMNCVPTK